MMPEIRVEHCKPWAIRAVDPQPRVEHDEATLARMRRACPQSW